MRPEIRRAISRLPAHERPVDDMELGLFIDDFDGKREAREERRLRRPAGRTDRKSGWRRGQPQCPRCRRFLNARGGWCPDCRAYS